MTMTMTRPRIMLLCALTLGAFALGAAPSCQRDLTGAHCPCLEGWTCCGDNTCRPAGISCGGGPVLVDGGACVQPGNGVKLTSSPQLEALIEGDWIRCSGKAYPAAYGVGIRISADHTWNAVEVSDAGEITPITTGFDGYGMWRDSDQGNGRFQFDLLIPSMGNGQAYFLTVVDSGHMQMDPADGETPNVYRRPDVSCPCLPGGADAGGDDGGDAGPGVVDGGPAACSAPEGAVVSYTTVAQLESMIEADWMRCSGMGYPAEFGVGLRISPDHTWNALEDNGAGGLAPITTGFDGYGTWTAQDEGAGLFQFNLLKVNGGGAGFAVTFTDTGKMQIDPGGLPTVYQRLPAAGGR